MAWPTPHIKTTKGDRFSPTQPAVFGSVPIAEFPERRTGKRGTQFVGASLTVIRGKRSYPEREPVS